MRSRRIWMVLGIAVACLCLWRVLAFAGSQKDPRDVEENETYSAVEGGDTADSSGDLDKADEEGRPEIRISRPDEAEGRVAADEQGYDQVPGAERLLQRQKAEQAKGEIAVPVRKGVKLAGRERGASGSRKPAAESGSEAPLPPSPIAMREPKPVTPAQVAPAAVQAQPQAQTAASVEAAPMEPRAFTTADARARAAETQSEAIQSTNTPLAGEGPGIRSEPRMETRVDPPLPSSTSRSGVQEVSLIVSDYGYFPQRLIVTQNIPVKLYLSTPSKVTMCFILDALGVKKGITPGRIEEIAFTPRETGEYRFYCPVKSIEGRLIVREQPDAPASTDQAPGRGVASAQTEPKKEAPQLKQINDE